MVKRTLGSLLHASAHCPPATENAGYTDMSFRPAYPSTQSPAAGMLSH